VRSASRTPSDLRELASGTATGSQYPPILPAGPNCSPFPPQPAIKSSAPIWPTAIWAAEKLNVGGGAELEGVHEGGMLMPVDNKRTVAVPLTGAMRG
jgi:hypothetical protein